ncbi:UNVERIFIED_CONTAM: AP-3 complex subunit mu-2 [Siphonaria sp. JEL0065]|nr:AP-3 complex subunit mu-2 [Siphonaria sp. JEL0065]
MDSFFVLSSSGTPLIEKHSRSPSASARLAVSLFYDTVARSSALRTVPVAADTLAQVTNPNTINLNNLNVGQLASTASAAAVSAAATTTAAVASGLNSLSSAIPSLSNLASQIPTVQQPAASSASSSSGAFFIGGDGLAIINETNVFDVIPLASTDEFYLIHLQRNVQPLEIVEFLQRIVDLLIEYFGSISEILIKEHFVVVHELLEEMLDHGHPYITEPAILKDMVPPPSLLSSVMNAVSLGPNSFGTQHAPSASFSQIPWRSVGIKYAKNEFYMDVIESLNVIMDKNGAIITGNIGGEIRCSSRLSGMPDLTLNFQNPRLFEDTMTSFHPCVRYFRFEKERVVSFVPPDGDFKLMDYVIPVTNSSHLPVHLKPQIRFTKSGGSLSIGVHPRSTGQKPLDQVIVSLVLPPQIVSAKIDANVGSVQYDQNARKIRWIIPKIAPDASIPYLTGTLHTNVQETPEPIEEEIAASTAPSNTKRGTTKSKSNSISTTAKLQQQLAVSPLVDISIEFKVAMHTASGLKIDQLNVHGEGYVPFKGVRAFSRSGKYQVRV